MKKLAILALPLLLAACSSVGQVTANNRIGVGVAVDDTGSSEVATKSIIAATDTSPAQIQWAITPGKGVTFTFMTTPGSEAAYITGYRITKQVLITANGTTTDTDGELVSKSNVYLTSGFACTERTALRSCANTDTSVVPANGMPAQMNIYLEGGLGSMARSTNAGVTLITDIEFIGQSSTGSAVSFKANGIVSQGVRAGID